MCHFCTYITYTSDIVVASFLEDLLKFVTADSQTLVIERAIDHFQYRKNFVHLGKFINLLHNNTLLQDHLFVSPSNKRFCKIVVSGYEKHCYSH